MIKEVKCQLLTKTFLFYSRRFDGALKSKDYAAMKNSGKRAIWIGRRTLTLENKIKGPRISSVRSFLSAIESAYKHYEDLGVF